MIIARMRQMMNFALVIFIMALLSGCARGGISHTGIIVHLIGFFVFFFSCTIILFVKYRKMVEKERRKRGEVMDESSALRKEFEEMKSIMADKMAKDKATAIMMKERMMRDEMKNMCDSCEWKKVKTKFELSSEPLHSDEVMNCSEHELALSREYILLRVEKLSANKMKKGTGYSGISAFEEKDWKEVEWLLMHSDDDFVGRMRKAFPNINIDDLRFCMLFRLGLSIKQVADLYGIAEPSVKHNAYLMKAKLGMGDSNLSLRKFLSGF